jgi:hypothetical protein
VEGSINIGLACVSQRQTAFLQTGVSKEKENMRDFKHGTVWENGIKI